jgi:hypothetical protein
VIEDRPLKQTSVRLGALTGHAADDRAFHHDHLPEICRPTAPIDRAPAPAWTLHWWS